MNWTRTYKYLGCEEKFSFALLLTISFSFGGTTLSAQELEPRALINIPVGTNFAMRAYGFAQGNILFDPALPLEDVNAKTHAVLGAWVRSHNFFGMGAKTVLILPAVTGDWTGIYQGEDAYNNSFWGGNTLAQNPIGTIKLDLIKSFNKGIWALLGADFNSFSLAYQFMWNRN